MPRRSRPRRAERRESPTQDAAGPADNPEEKWRSLEYLNKFAQNASAVGRLVSMFALASANFTAQYKEPGESITRIDAEIGNERDIQDPLLTTHRLAKFYVISAGEALRSCSDLITGGVPMPVGVAALARTAVEHSSKAIYLSDPDIDWRVRVLRAQRLISASSAEYKSSNLAGAEEMIQLWDSWRERTGRLFSTTPKPSAKSNSSLVKDYIPHALAYDELSRPTHGNAVWLIIANVQEQKGTNYAWSTTLRNLQCAVDAVILAAGRLCQMWSLDTDCVVATAVERFNAPSTGRTWTWLAECADEFRDAVNELSENVEVDWTPDPQPVRD